MRKLNGGLRAIVPFGGERISKFVTVLSAALVILSGPKLFASLLQVYVIERIGNQQSYSSALADFSDSLQQIMAIIVLPVYIVFFVCFLFWLKRRYENLGTLFHVTSYQPGWAIGGFFIPLLNFVRPFQIVIETLEFSDCKKKPKAKSDLALTSVWWILFWVNNILGQLILRSAPKEGAAVKDYVGYAWNMVFSDSIECLLYPLFLLLILKVGAKQERAIQEIQENQAQSLAVPPGSLNHPGGNLNPES